jgi:predicted RNA binding protein YcfA (HicA-like mRNA interferase family)
MSSEVRFAEVRRLLERNGWNLVRTSGSHHIFEKSGSKLLSIPVHHGKVKPVYVRQIEKAIKEN